MTHHDKDFKKALEIGRPPTITRLFPNSRALIVSGKVIDRAMLAKGQCMTIAANARNIFVIRGTRPPPRGPTPRSSSRLPSPRGGRAYCAVNYWNMATYVDAVCNELEITVPVAIHVPTITASRGRYRRRQDRDPQHVRRGDHLHRHRRLPPP